MDSNGAAAVSAGAAAVGANGSTPIGDADAASALESTTVGDAVQVDTGVLNPAADWDLPAPTLPPVANPVFQLGDMDETETLAEINNAYEKCVHFSPNAFRIPCGRVGRRFVAELARFLLCFGETGSYSKHAFTIAAVFQQLLLQKPQGDDTKHTAILERRLGLWAKGEIAELLREFGIIQEARTKRDGSGSAKERKPADSARQFAESVNNDRLSAALRQLSK